MGALRNMNSKATEIVDAKFKELLLSGNWEKCRYNDNGNGTVSYNMIEYATKSSQYCKAVQNKLVEKGYKYGLWQNLRNQKYLDDVKSVVDGLTAEEVDSSERFRTMFD